MPLEDLPRTGASGSGEATPVSVDSDDQAPERPIIREQRARFHRVGEEMQVTLEVAAFYNKRERKIILFF